MSGITNKSAIKSTSTINILCLFETTLYPFSMAFRLIKAIENKIVRISNKYIN